jgi:ubiquinone biosynthesis protein COQ9
MTRKKEQIENKIALAALKLAAHKPWAEVTLGQIAKAADVPVARLKKLFPSTEDILPAIVRVIDSETARNVGKLNRKTPAHDRLFETMMARFDSLQSHRSGIISIADACRNAPPLVLKLLPAQMNAVEHLLSLSLPGQGRALGLLRKTWLFAIYLLALHRWIQDDTADMAKTMSFIDRSLRKGEKIMKRYFNEH